MVLGSGEITINKERAAHADFTAPYLKTLAFCISNGNALDVKNRTKEDIIWGLVTWRPWPYKHES